MILIRFWVTASLKFLLVGNIIIFSVTIYCVHGEEALCAEGAKKLLEMSLTLTRLPD